MLNFKGMKLSSKVLFGSLLSMIAFVALLCYIYPSIRRLEYEGKRQKIASLVDSASGVLEYYDSLVKKDQMKLPEAQKMAMQVLATLRYDRNDYFWINDFNHVVVMHPNKDIVGKDQSNNRDPKGTYMFQEFVRVCRDKGAGFVEYWWAKQNERDPSPKISYVKAFQPWEWILGTGIYVDDVEKELNQWLYSVGSVVLVITGRYIIYDFEHSVHYLADSSGGRRAHGWSGAGGFGLGADYFCQSFLSRRDFRAGRRAAGDFLVSGRDVFHDQPECG